MDNRLEVRIEYRRNVIDIGAVVEEIADFELLEVLIAVELLIVGIGSL